MSCDPLISKMRKQSLKKDKPARQDQDNDMEDTQMVFDEKAMMAPAKFRSDVIYFHEFSKSKFVELKQDQFEQI
jgi:hypothetical protein